MRGGGGLEDKEWKRMRRKRTRGGGEGERQELDGGG